MSISLISLGAVLLGLSQLSGVTAAPVADNAFRVTLSAVDAFPHARTNLSAFDIDVNFIDYNSTTESWLLSLDPSTAGSDEEKARILTEAAYARPFDETDADMTGDVAALLDAVAGNVSTAASSKLEARKTNKFATSASHAVIWHTCAATFSCLTGLTCTFSIVPNSSPRDMCKKVGSQNCCVSWSTKTVKAGFFKTTWDVCNEAVKDEGLTKASCEGYGETAGGDVCLSNRAKHCT